MSDTASHLSLYNKAMLENIFSNDPLNLPLGILKMRFKNKSKPSTVTQTCNPSTQNTKLRQEDWLLRVPRLVWAWFCLRQLKTNPDICCHINIFFKSYWNHHFALQCLYSTMVKPSVVFAEILLRFCCLCVAGISQISQHHTKARKAAKRRVQLSIIMLGNDYNGQMHLHVHRLTIRTRNSLFS